MEFKTFLTDHWNIFSDHLCEFHPLDEEFIAKYEYQLCWSDISKNQTLDWDFAFIKKYENRLKWHFLVKNPAICWDKNMFTTFKKRIDNDYWYSLFQNKNLVLTDEIMEKLKKGHKIRRLSSRNLHLTKELKAKYSDCFYEDTMEETSVSELSKADKALIKNIDKSFADEDFYNNQKWFYFGYIAKELEKVDYKKLFEEKYDFSQRYFIMTGLKHDTHGFAPHYAYKPHNPFDYVAYMTNYDLFTPEKKIVLQEHSKEGPARLHETLPEYALQSVFPTMIVSEGVKTVLESFKLTKSLFHEVEVKLTGIKSDSKFYVFHVDEDTLAKDLDFEKLSFKYRTMKGTRLNPEYSKFEDINKEIKSYEEYKQVFSEIVEEMDEKIKSKYMRDSVDRLQFTPETRILKSDYDVFSHTSFGRRYIIVNEHVKNKLEKYFPGEVKFSSAQNLKIKIDQDVYETKDKIHKSEILEVTKVSFKKLSKTQFYEDKMERLKNNPVIVPDVELDETPFKETEKRLNVLFDNSFKKSFTKKKDYGRYELMELKEFETYNEYADTNPESYKAVIVAQNGFGDYLGFLLEKESDYKLGKHLYEFFHEIGSVKKYKK